MIYLGRFDPMIGRKGQALLESIVAIVVFTALIAGVFSFFVWYKQDMAQQEAAFAASRSFSGRAGLDDDFYYSAPANII